MKGEDDLVAPVSGRKQPLAGWVTAAAVALVIGLVAAAVLTALGTRERILAERTASLARVGLTLAEHTQRVIFSADLLASSIEERFSAASVASPAALRDQAATQAMHDLLIERVLLTTDIDAMSIIDADGRFINTSRSWPTPSLDLSDREYYLKLRDNPTTAFVISDPIKNRATGQESILFVRRIGAPDGSLLGLVTITLSTSRFEKLFAAVLPDDGASVTLLRRDGMVLVERRSDSGAPERTAETRRFIEDTLARSERGTFRAAASETGGDAQLLALHAIRGYPLAISVAMAESVVLAEWWRLAWLVLAATAVASLLVLLLAVAVRRQARMQARVAEAAVRLGAANQRLELLNKELEAFTYSVSHDLRAPLRAISGYSTILLMDSAPKLAADEAQYLQRINAGALRMERIIDKLLQLSRISRREVNRQDFDLSLLARSVADTLAEAEPQRQVQLVVMPGLRANGDPGLVRSLLENLIGNAWKFTALVTEARVEVGMEQHDGTPAFFVRDNGAGFDMQYADKLFQPFQRLHHQDEFEGTGIGLSIVQRIVVRHGGAVSAAGEPGKGATFWFTLGG